MSLFQFQDLVLLQYKKFWFLWEPAWETFRPIDGIRWSGTAFVLDDKNYTSDLLSEDYGFGTPIMRKLCEQLANRYQSGISTAKRVHTPEVGETEWFRDRFVAFTPCATKDKSSWRRMCRGKHRTLRHPPKGTHRTQRHVHI